ncbi:capsid protein [Listeria booriae]|uniref:phage minor capsid protein n=1 Tax=Listeria booriae TaxID=1552123 RepID=UPI00164E3B7E|nr:phage minor capsid protein [Listeria booriae]MBC6163303.1 capsid protein [Listeria booriae]
MSITPHQLDLYTSQVVDMYRALEIDIFKQIARRLKVSGNVTLLEWQIETLAQLNMINNNTIKELSIVSSRSSEEIKRIVSDAGYSAIKDVDSHLKKVFDPKPLPSDLDVILSAYVGQVFLELDNLVNQTLITTNYGTGLVAQMYQRIINETTAKVISGVKTLDKALEETILRWANKGIDSGFVDKGGHTWSLERYVDTVIRSTVNNTYNELSTSRMGEYDVYTVLMTSIYDAAPRCAGCQGLVLDMRPFGKNESGYPSIYEFGYGKPGGTLGINCRHRIIPFVPGVNTNNQPIYDTEDMDERYKYRQMQRTLERRIRATKKNIIITQELGSDKLDHFKRLLSSQQAQMRDLLNESNASHLRRNYKREKVVTPKEILTKNKS